MEISIQNTNDLEAFVEKYKLRCSNCNSIPKGGVPIFQCGSGHLTCGDCSGQIRASMKCSHCDQTTQRSVLAENLIKELPIACKNKGCPRVEKEGDDMRDHEQNCFWRPSYDPSSRGSSPPTQREGELQCSSCGKNENITDNVAYRCRQSCHYYVCHVCYICKAHEGHRHPMERVNLAFPNSPYPLRSARSPRILRGNASPTPSPESSTRSSPRATPQGRFAQSPRPSSRGNPGESIDSVWGGSQIGYTPAYPQSRTPQPAPHQSPRPGPSNVPKKETPPQQIRAPPRKRKSAREIPESPNHHDEQQQQQCEPLKLVVKEGRRSSGRSPNRKPLKQEVPEESIDVNQPGPSGLQQTEAAKPLKKRKHGLRCAGFSKSTIPSINEVPETNGAGAAPVSPGIKLRISKGRIAGKGKDLKAHGGKPEQKHEPEPDQDQARVNGVPAPRRAAGGKGKGKQRRVQQTADKNRRKKTRRVMEKLADIPKIGTIKMPEESCVKLSNGWSKMQSVRKGGKTTGQRDVYIITPDNKKLRSTGELARYIHDRNLHNAINAYEVNFEKVGKDPGARLSAATQEFIRFIESGGTYLPPAFKLNN